MFSQARTGLKEHLEFYNHERLHQSLRLNTPAQVLNVSPRPHPSTTNGYLSPIYAEKIYYCSLIPSSYAA